MTKDRQYYSVRTGKIDGNFPLELEDVLELFRSLFKSWIYNGYFQQHFGYHCVDKGYVPGERGLPLEKTIALEVRKTNLCPIEDACQAYSEDDLFDVIEFLYDHVSKPRKRYFHNWSGCGWHCDEFGRIDRDAGVTEYCEKINNILKDYHGGYSISKDGEILVPVDPGIKPLLEAEVVHPDTENVTFRIENAIKKFRRYKSSTDDRRDAIRDLADVLEYLRPQIKKCLLRKDEDDLFKLANQFGIRHHGKGQKIDYDREIWYNWAFYYYLATIHAILQLIDRQSDVK
jgi:hypothetical protein